MSILCNDPFELECSDIFEKFYALCFKRFRYPNHFVTVLTCI